MSRRIQTRRLQGIQGSSTQIDTYFDKVIKYIPADVVAAWTFVTGLVSSSGEQTPKNTVLWIAYAFGVLFTALWTWKQTQEKNKSVAKTQILVSSGAFSVWVAALGGPFESLPFYQRLYGSLFLIAYTLLVGLINPPEP